MTLSRVQCNVLSHLVLCGAAVTLMSAPAQASKARLAALQFADFWRDTQTVFIYPQYASELGQYATLELGPTGTFSTGTHAEGGVTHKYADGAAGIYLGHQSPTLNSVYTAAGTSEQSNPLYLYYAKGATGYGLNLSYSDVKSAGNKELSIGGSFGTRLGAVDLGSILTVYSRSETSGRTTKVLPALELNGNSTMGTVKVYGAGSIGRTDVAGATEAAYSVRAGAQNHAFKVGQTGTVFYGTELGYAKNGATKGLNLPVYAGLETDLTSWAVLRGAISQSLIGYTDTGTKDINANNTLVTLGGSLKYNGFQLDGLLAAAATGNFNGTSFLTTTSLTYFF